MGEISEHDRDLVSESRYAAENIFTSNSLEVANFLVLGRHRHAVFLDSTKHLVRFPLFLVHWRVKQVIHGSDLGR